MTIPENATYTAAEVKVLTAKAGEFGYRLGRKEAGDEIASRCERDVVYDTTARWYFAKLARTIASQPSPDATSGRADPEEPK